MPKRLLHCLALSLLRTSFSEQSSRLGRRQRSSDDQFLELSEDEGRDERPVMRREHQKSVEVDALANLVQGSEARSSVGFADEFLEELLQDSKDGENLVQNPGFEAGSSWNKDCPNVHYNKHADVTGISCSTRGFWSGAAHQGNTSGNVWSIKALTDCFKNTRGAVYQDIRTTAGAAYELSFYAIDAFTSRKASNKTSQLHVEVQSPPGTSVIDEPIALTGSASQPVAGSWSYAGPLAFKAADENTRLYFYAGGSACPMLDNVAVRVSGESDATTTAKIITLRRADSPPLTTLASTASTTAPSTSNPGAFADAGAEAAAAARARGEKPHQQALAAAHAAAAAAQAAGLSLEQQAFAAAKAAALAIRAASGTVELECAEAGRASFFASLSGGMAQEQIATLAGDAALAAVKLQALSSDGMVECLAVSVRTACKASGTDSEKQAECAGASAIAAAQKAGLSEDEQAAAAGKAVEALMSMKAEVTTDAWEQLSATTTPNSQVQELIKQVQEAKKAAGEAEAAASEARREAEEAKKTTTQPHNVPPGASYQTEVLVTEHPTANPEVPTQRPFTTTQAEWKNACPDNTRAPRGSWVVYNLSTTPILHSCLVKSLKQQVPDECCNGGGAINLVGATFEELYYSNDYGSCVTLSYAGPLAGKTAKLQCNSDNTVTYGESRCGEDCTCKFEEVYKPGCYRASDALPGTAWFVVIGGCDCTDQKAVLPHQFSLPPLEQNVGAADVLNVGPEEAAKALNRQRQQLRSYYDEMIKDERVMSQVVSRLSSGKPIADAIFGMDTGEIPVKVTQRMLDAATQDSASAKYAINATVSIMGHALSTLKSGKPLADAVFGGDTSHLIQPHQPMAPGQVELGLPKSTFKGKLPDFKKKDEPVQTLRFAGDFKSIVGERLDEFLEECSVALAPAVCRDARPGSVLVTLVAESWAELQKAQRKAKNLRLPSFGTLEEEQDSSPKTKAADAFRDAAAMSPEEKKQDLLNPDITENDVKIVQSIFDKVHEEEEKEVEDAKEKLESGRIVPSAQERSNSDVAVGVGLSLFGMAAMCLCAYSCFRGRERVKQKLGSAASKRLMKRAQSGDTQLVVTGTESLKVGDEVLLGKEKVTIQEIAISVTLAEGLGTACKSGEAVTAEGSSESGSLSKDVAEKEKELLVLNLPSLKKGAVVKVGSNEKCTVKNMSNLLSISPALKSAHMIGSKLRQPGEAEEVTEIEATEAESEAPLAAAAGEAPAAAPEAAAAAPAAAPAPAAAEGASP